VRGGKIHIRYPHRQKPFSMINAGAAIPF